MALDLPVDPGFVSVLPRPSFEEMLLWLEQVRQWFPQSFPTQAERLARKCAAEFVLRIPLCVYFVYFGVPL
jgi:hypothetical protein